jgi:hypothetical protein
LSAAAVAPRNPAPARDVAPGSIRVARRGVRFGMSRDEVLKVECPTCGALAGEPCFEPGMRTVVHTHRVRAAELLQHWTAPTASPRARQRREQWRRSRSTRRR